MWTDDEAELERELSWRRPTLEAERRRDWKRRPPGTNVMLGLTGLLWLAGLVFHLKLSGGTTTGYGIGAWLFFALAMLLYAVLADFLSRRLWVLVGPAVRGVLRPIGLLGPLPVVLIFLVAVGAVLTLGRSAASAGSMTEFLEGGPMEGKNWRVHYSRDEQGVRLIPATFAEAEARCATYGADWRLPGKQDQALVTRSLKAFLFKKAEFHALPDSEGALVYTFNRGIEKPDYFGLGRPSRHRKTAVLCLRDGR